jgi:formamidopyrimidine-DNA glycosylase
MPELPEVENVALTLREALLDRRLDRIRVRFAGALKPSPRVARRAVEGKRLVSVRRHGKYLLLRFVADRASASGRPSGSGGALRAVQLLLHLRMTGQLFVSPEYRPDKHVRLMLEFEDQRAYYRDMRKFGGFTLVDDVPWPQEIAHIGPDMLEIPYRDWYRRLQGRRAPMKSLLLHQGIAAGLGNIYADETLFRAGVHPVSSPADLEDEALRRVHREARRILRLAIRHGGTTYNTFVDVEGKRGRFRSRLRVYGREGEPCRTCGTAVERLVLAGRSSHFCPRCQDRG